ncbi:MAG: type IV secretion system DNA-binding domain-containing protein [Terracidiphilus sp.]
MRPLRFPGTFRWLIVAVLAVVFGLPLLPLAAWFTVAMPPLQRYYLLAYVESAEAGKTSGSTTPVRWLYKTASGREHALVMNPDVVSASGGKLPVRLSSSAANDGWTKIEMSAPVRVDSAQLAQFLQDNIYNGRGFWTLMVEPILFGLAFILFLVAIALHIRERLRSGSKHEQRHGRRTRGPELLSSWRWNWKTKPDGIRFQLRWRNFLLDWSSKQLPSWATPTFRMRRNLEASHVLLMGDSGSGKSSAIRQILRQIAERGETAIVYDPALEFTPEFYSPKRGDMILNPLDTRCPYWDIADEVSTAEVATAMAAALFPEKDHEKEFFTDAPRRIFARLMCRRPTPQELVQWMSDPAEIARMVQGTPYAAFLDSSAPAQSAGIISSFNMIADSFELLPSEDDTRQRFSTSRWEFERNKWVFLTSRPAFREKLLPLHSVWLDMLILRMMAPCVNPAKPVWFVLDELASLNKLPQLHTVVTESRKSGNPVVLGFQGRSQLEKRYGKDAEVILSQPATKIFLKTSEPHSAKWVSDAIGEVELERLKESRTAGLIGGKKQYTLEITTQPLVMASEISGLEPLHGYIKQENYVVRVRFPYVAPIEKQPRFIERAVSVSPRAVAVQQATAISQQAATAAPFEPPKKPVKKQGIFPGASQKKAVNEEPKTWDESQWIE